MAVLANKLLFVLLGITIVGKQSDPRGFAVKCVSHGHHRNHSDRLSIELEYLCSQVRVPSHSALLPIDSLNQWLPFLYGGTLFSYLNFRRAPIILVDNKKVFTENLSMICQFSSKIMVIFKKKRFSPKLTLFLSFRISYKNRKIRRP